MQRNIERLRRKLSQMPRIAAVLTMALVLSASLFTTVYAKDVVVVTDSDGQEVTLLTSSCETEEILALAGITVEDCDKVEYTTEDENTACVTIERAFPVSLEADGATFTTRLVEGTVADLLTLSGVQLGQDDFVEPALDTPLDENLEVAVHRVTFEEESRREEVSDEAVEAYVQGLEAPEGGEVAFLQSRGGVYDVTYVHRLVDGEVASSEITSLEAVLHPYDEATTEFVPGVPVSTIEGFDGVVMGEDGLPTSYSRVMQGAVATAYSSSGGRGASGMGLYCGTVAVNPNVIPYGTRLYITSADGGFVYGFAIATDCGTAMMEGRVDVDLYFATNAECLRFGKRALDIYILN